MNYDWTHFLWICTLLSKKLCSVIWLCNAECKSHFKIIQMNLNQPKQSLTSRIYLSALYQNRPITQMESYPVWQDWHIHSVSDSIIVIIIRNLNTDWSLTWLQEFINHTWFFLTSERVAVNLYSATDADPSQTQSLTMWLHLMVYL